MSLVAATSVSIEQTQATESRATLGQSQCGVGRQMRWTVYSIASDGSARRTWQAIAHNVYYASCNVYNIVWFAGSNPLTAIFFFFPPYKSACTVVAID